MLHHNLGLNHSRGSLCHLLRLFYISGANYDFCSPASQFEDCLLSSKYNSVIQLDIISSVTFPMPAFPPVTTATFPSNLLAEVASLPENQPVYLQKQTVTLVKRLKLS